MATKTKELKGLTQDMTAPVTNRHAAVTAPSDWVKRFADRAPDGNPVLDLACGGRHGRLFRERGHPVTFVDIDVTGLRDLDGDPDATVIAADLEGGDAWPLGTAGFGAVVVTNYLWRPLMHHIVTAVAPGGILIYETFAVGNEKYGKPDNPDFLLHPNELLRATIEELEIVAYQHGFREQPKPAVVQAIAAIRR